MRAQYDAEVNGRLRRITVQRQEGRFVVTVDGREWMVDAVRVDGHRMSLLISEIVRLKADGTASGVVRLKADGTASGAVRLKADGTSKADGATRPVGAGFSRTFARTASYEVTLMPAAGTGRVDVGIGSVTVPVSLNGRRRSDRKEDGPPGPRVHGGDPERVVAPMPGKVVRVLVKTGEAVRARQPVVVIEAMKMENELRAGRDGIVSEMRAADGQSVDAGALLAVIT